MRKNAYTNKSKGAIAYIAVLLVGVFLIGLVLNTYRAAIDTQKATTRSQVRVNYKAQEQVFLNELLNEVPLAAMRSMMQGSANDTSGPGGTNANSWEALFQGAVDRANFVAKAEDATSDIAGNLTTITGKQIGEIRSSNLAGSAITNIRPYGGTAGNVFVHADTAGAITIPDSTGATRNVSLPAMQFGHPTGLIHGAYSASPTGTNANLYPIISSNKIYSPSSASVNQVATNPANPGATDILLEPLQNDPRFALLRYPDIKFKYRIDDRLIAKRNWWAFSVDFSSGVEGVPALTKDYVLSIYEVPLQTPISSLNKIIVGKKVSAFETGGTVNWTSSASLNVIGGLYGEEVELNNSFREFTSVASRSQIKFDGNNASSAGIQGFSGALANQSNESLIKNKDGSDMFVDDAAEIYAKGQNIDAAFPLSSSSNETRSLFIPIRARKEQFFRTELPTNVKDSNGNNSNLSVIRPKSGVLPAATALSNTDWEKYTSVARSAAIQVTVTALAPNGTPTEMKIDFYDPSNASGRAINLFGGPTGLPFPDSTNLFSQAFEGQIFNFDKIVRDRDANGNQTDSRKNLVNHTEPRLKLNLGQLAAAINLNKSTNEINSISVDYVDGLSFNLGTQTLAADSDTSLQLFFENVADDLLDLTVLTDISGNSTTGFANGLSIAHNGTVYLPAQINLASHPRPSGSVYPDVNDFRTPLSVFAIDKRFGTSRTASDTGVLISKGRMGSVRTRDDSSTATYDPLSARISGTDLGDASRTTYDLQQMFSAAEVPPLNLVYWLVTIEELQDNFVR